jgi:hypothetical protein
MATIENKTGSIYAESTDQEAKVVLERDWWDEEYTLTIEIADVSYNIELRKKDLKALKKEIKAALAELKER